MKGRNYAARCYAHTGVAVAAGAAAGGVLTDAAAAQNEARFAAQPALDARNRILIKGATIISMDPASAT